MVTEFELGYGFVPHRRLFCDVTAFYNDYDEMRSLRPVTPPPPVAVAAFEVANTLKAESYGVEAAATQRKRVAEAVA